MYNYKDNIVILKTIIMLSAIVFYFVGCASSNVLVIKDTPTEITTCEDDNLYHQKKWTEKRLVSKTCGKNIGGKDEL